MYLFDIRIVCMCVHSHMCVCVCVCTCTDACAIVHMCKSKYEFLTLFLSFCLVGSRYWTWKTKFSGQCLCPMSCLSGSWTSSWNYCFWVCSLVSVTVFCDLLMYEHQYLVKSWLFWCALYYSSNKLLLITPFLGDGQGISVQ